MSTKRHPFDSKLKLAADANGHLSAYCIDFTANKGAYFISGPAPISRIVHMLSSAYDIPNIDALGKLAYTNTCYGGAARGAGPPQVNFALESAIDMLADKLGIDPLEFRKMNSLKPGGTQATGTVVSQVALPRALRPDTPAL